MFDQMKKNMDTVLNLVSNDLKQVKTGRAKPSLIEDVQIEAYGGNMALKEVASIAAPDSHLLTVSPWDKSKILVSSSGFDCFFEFDLGSGKAALMFGTELNGLSKRALELADEFVRIPMVGFTESYNISVSAAIAFLIALFIIVL